MSDEVQGVITIIRTSTEDLFDFPASSFLYLTTLASYYQTWHHLWLLVLLIDSLTGS